jgi:hypothetical protein
MASPAKANVLCSGYARSLPYTLRVSALLVSDTQSSDPFALVLGSRRGIDINVWRERDFTTLQSELDGCSDEEAVAAFYRARGHDNPASAPLRQSLAQRLSASAWRHWWHQGLDQALLTLGLGVNNFSPWLLSEEAVDGSCHRVVHIADIALDARWPKMPDVRTGFGVTTSLCGLDAKQLNTALNRKSYHRLPRSWWLAADGKLQKRGIRGLPCWRCQELSVDLTIPALSEDSYAGARSGERVHRSYDQSDYSQDEGVVSQRQLATLERRAYELLGRELDISALMYKEAHAFVFARLAAAVAADPIPVLMHVLAVKERAHLTKIAQPRLHEHLSSLDWSNMLTDVLSDFNITTHVQRHQRLHSELLQAVHNLH